MSDQEADQERRDTLLLRLLKTPPQPRPKREREPGKPVRQDGKRVIAVKPAPSAERS